MKAEQLDTEDWKHINNENKERRDRRRDERTDMIYRFCMLNDIKISEKTIYQLRLMKEGFPDVDLFPTSSKIHILQKNKKGKYLYADLYKWLKEFYINQ